MFRFMYVRPIDRCVIRVRRLGLVLFLAFPPLGKGRANRISSATPPAVLVPMAGCGNGPPPAKTAPPPPARAVQPQGQVQQHPPARDGCGFASNAEAPGGARAREFDSNREFSGHMNGDRNPPRGQWGDDGYNAYGEGQHRGSSSSGGGRRYTWQSDSGQGRGFQGPPGNFVEGQSGPDYRNRGGHRTHDSGECPILLGPKSVVTIYGVCCADLMFFESPTVEPAARMTESSVTGLVKVTHVTLSEAQIVQQLRKVAPGNF